MKRFRFRLDRLLRARRLEERERTRDLAEAMTRADQLRTEAEEGAHHRQRAETQIAGLRTEPSRAGVRASLETALRTIRRRATRQRLSYSEALVQVEQARKRMIDARREAETLEKLKSKRRAEWEAEVARLDQKTNDEIAARMADGSER